MKYRSFGPLLLCGLALVGFRANSQNQTRSNAHHPGRVSQAELNQLAKNLSANGLQQYVYRVDTIGAKDASKMDKPRIVRGFFMMRQPAFMKPLPNGFFDDGIGDLVYFGKFNRDGKTNVDYAITFAASGDVIAAFDINNDGLADGILGRDSMGTSWSLNNKSLGALQQCFESRAFGDALLCISGPTGGRVRSKTDPRSGTGRTGSDADDPDSLGSFIDDLSKLDCDPLPNPRGPVSESPQEREKRIQAEYRSHAEQARMEAKRAREDHREGLAAALDREADAADAAASARQEWVELRPTPPASDEQMDNWARSQARLEAAEREYRNAQRETNRQRLIVPLPPSGPRPRGGGSTSSRPLGPEGVNEDPRCQGLRTQIKQGLWFMSKEYCPDRNFVDCWARAQDAVSEGTDGRCHPEPGPAGGQIVVCERPTDEKNKDVTQTPPPEPVPGPVDGPPLRFTVSPGVKLNYTFISTTQLGAMLGVQCQRDDRCGGMDNIQKRQATPN